jgi:ParB family transcriptional regulator, chromosome partitioning protein
MSSSNTSKARTGKNARPQPQEQRIEWIPIREVRIGNPRARNQVTFQNITVNISRVGLKKPITVTKRELEDDGTRYDLACGQGRLEALRALGDERVPAIIKDATAEERYLMSVVENIARRRPSNTELVREVRNLLARGYKNTVIAEKIGFDITHINGIIKLLRKGEEKLIAKVEAGAMPLSVAVQIACAPTNEVQKALSDAYDSGELRGGRFRAAKALVAKRFSDASRNGGASTEGGAASQSETLSKKDLVREYERHTQQQRALVQRAAVVTERLAVVRSAMAQLFGDDHFVTLLRAESLDKVPAELASTRTMSAAGKA